MDQMRKDINELMNKSKNTQWTIQIHATKLQEIYENYLQKDFIEGIEKMMDDIKQTKK